MTNLHQATHRSRHLSDGRHVQIRELNRADADALRDAIAKADPLDLWMRFMGSRPSTATLVHQLEVADGVHAAALGAFDDDGALVGVAQFDRYPDSTSADAAVEVATEWQQCGLGMELARELGTLALERGVERFVIPFFADNPAVIRMLSKSPFPYTVMSDNAEATVTVELSGDRQPAA